MSEKTRAEQAQFEAAIKADRNDVALRFIYADWLEEHGQPAEAKKQRSWPETFEAAEAAIQRLADEAGISYEEMLEYAAACAERGEYACEGSRWVGGPDADDKFWDAYEIVTGIPVEENRRGSVFSCAC